MPNPRQRVLELFLADGTPKLKTEICERLSYRPGTIGVVLANLKDEEILCSRTVWISKNGKLRRFQEYFLAEEGRELAELELSGKGLTESSVSNSSAVAD